MVKRTDEADARKSMMDKGFSPSVPYVNALAPWPGVCLICGNPSSPTYHSIQRGNGACLYCARKKIDPATAEGKMLARDFAPSTPYPGGNNPWPGVCLKCGRPGAPRFSAMYRQGPCLYCAENKVDDSIALGTMLARDFSPSTPFPGANIPWPGVCLVCGQPGSARYGDVSRGKGACAYCGGKKVDPTIAFGKMLARDFMPSSEFQSSDDPWPGRCIKCGGASAPKYQQVRSGYGVCQHCAPFGFSPTKPATVYFVTDGLIVKCGIANRTAMKARLRAHRRQGLNAVLHLISFDLGKDARALELLWCEYVKANPMHAVTKELLPDGYTEALHDHDGLSDFIDALMSLRQFD